MCSVRNHTCLRGTHACICVFAHMFTGLRTACACLCAHIYMRTCLRRTRAFTCTRTDARMSERTAWDVCHHVHTLNMHSSLSTQHAQLNTHKTPTQTARSRTSVHFTDNAQSVAI